MIESIGLPKDTMLDIEEFVIHCPDSSFIKTELDINMISVPVADQSTNLAVCLAWRMRQIIKFQSKKEA